MWPETTTFRCLVHHSLRRTPLCIDDCDVSVDAQENGLTADEFIPCADCPHTWIYLAQRTAAGLLLERVLDRDFAATKSLTTPLGEVPADEFLALQVLEQERTRFDEARRQREAEQQALDRAQQQLNERIARHHGG